ncbi:VOC family protein [Pseudomonas sp. G5(2012)]|jgi:catechol 2,3-dioxygenase-like lactoylglutathione lyase family enzyme|uniref:Dioxygenase n=2 Tax=Pseudomonas umsongensis TaxID=198618 RepID=A0ABX4DYQ7_9PSED|nr:VOC family protein [Pseudomonas sp. G5(2012)]EPA96185.1 lactoylglutathione lyase-like lyase [Pseudomonas sp. G5(2012)]NWL19434.1 dioxygenase [Pseudomonas umsongensis]OXR34528.1 dioxygenase [Pseudomonas umsongensis]SDS95205.1 Glyoxalase-like domain-containing protein [Pseudomonas umsongensis]
MILRMDHFTIVSDQLQVTRDFYVEVLGLVEGPRPPFPVPGFWLYTRNQPVLHVVGVAQMPEPRRGVLDHMAFHASGLQTMCTRLIEHGVRFKIIRAPGSQRTWQLFMQDPNGVEVELDFDASEEPPADWKERRAG